MSEIYATHVRLYAQLYVAQFSIQQIIQLLYFPLIYDKIKTITKGDKQIDYLH